MMKRFLCALLCLLFLPVLALSEDAGACAPELVLTWQAGSKKLDMAALSDGSDETGYSAAKSKTVELTATLAEGQSLSALYLRLDSLPQSVSLQMLNSKKKWEEAVSLTAPGAEFLLLAPEPLTGKLRLVLTYASSVACQLKELRAFGEGELPDTLPVWQQGQADVLVIADDLSLLDPLALRQWTGAGRSVAVCALMTPDSALTAFDSLRQGGISITPLFGGYAATGQNAAATLKKWKESAVLGTMTTWVRQYQPLLVVTAGDISGQLASSACQSAADISYALDTAERYGLWAVSQQAAVEQLSVDMIAQLPERSLIPLQKACAAAFAHAQSSDPSAIPYPDNRDEQGYLTEGEFVFEDPEAGLWAYLSPSLQVEIIRYDTSAPKKHRWFAAEVRFKPELEKFEGQLYVNASFKNQQIYPQTLAQTSRMVLAINGDYYLSRANDKKPIGNILRDYQVIYDVNPSKSSSWPNLDTLALHDDGTLSVYDAKEITATELAARGDVHDALAFGPYLVRDGRLNIYNDKNVNAAEPRCAIGMIEAGHYIIIDCEGRVPDGTKGLTVNQTAMLLYSYGVTEAFNLDGGSTSVLIFMGEKLNRTGKDTSVGSPRNQHELFGIGVSELVHTDWVNGKPGK